MQEERITRLLAAWRQGDPDAEAELFQLIYPYLHRIAASRLRSGRRTLSMDTTDLVHEAYLKLDAQREAWINRGQFFAIAARVMRYLILDQIRHRKRQKRGGEAERVSLDKVDLVSHGFSVDALALDGSLAELEQVDSDAAQVVEMKFFAGMSVKEISGYLEVSASTIDRRWRFARAWLKRHIQVP